MSNKLTKFADDNELFKMVKSKADWGKPQKELSKPDETAKIIANEIQCKLMELMLTLTLIIGLLKSVIMIVILGLCETAWTPYTSNSPPPTTPTM